MDVQFSATYSLDEIHHWSALTEFVSIGRGDAEVRWCLGSIRLRQVDRDEIGVVRLHVTTRTYTFTLIGG